MHSGSNGSNSNCCLLVRCHRLLCLPLDSLIREALNKPSIERDRPSIAIQRDRLPLQRVASAAATTTAKSFDSPQRAIATGNGWIHVSWTRPIPSIGFIDRICLLTRTSARQVVLAAFCQSINQCCRQSGWVWINQSVLVFNCFFCSNWRNLSLLGDSIEIKASSAGRVLRVELTSDGSLPNGDYYTLPLGSSALDDGQLVLKTLRRQSENRKKSYRILSTDTLFPFRVGLNDPLVSVLSVKMEILDGNRNSLTGSVLQWSSTPTPLIRKYLLLNDSFRFLDHF